jgi:hypothetical protein
MPAFPGSGTAKNQCDVWQFGNGRASPEIRLLSAVSNDGNRSIAPASGYRMPDLAKANVT